MSMVRYPLPITPAMLATANTVHEGKPRYSGSGANTDWSGGTAGNDIDVSIANGALGNSGSANIEAVYAPKTQTAKAALMVPPRQIVGDIGIDYGAYAGQTGRGGTIAPQSPYPDVNAPPAVAGVTPATGLAAGGTSVTITGTGFTGATAVTFGGTPATAVVVVNASTITATSPAKAAGTYDVRVTTPKGQSPIAGAADNFVYT
jgi:hypothetical protein